ncbi:MAG: anthranilate phosphoribosyltransferase [Actinomycetota bacterium]|nr:anthranilate phosphoribosyltransferase [Actinomycetota bacterium]
MGDFSWADVLARLLRREDLPVDVAAGAMTSIMSGEATPAHVAGFLIALRAKGESVNEIVGLARTMREFSLRVVVDGPVVDTCGTGGDRAGTVNISTMAALVAAGAGARVAKHGNRAASSLCGSADLLESFGVAIDLDPQSVAECIETAGIGFCFAQTFHPAMRFVGPARRELGVPTVFNFLGPLTNPAGAQYQTVGVSDPVMAPKMAEALDRLGTLRAFVFRGDDGLDELTTTTTSALWEVRGGVTQRTFDPMEVGIQHIEPAALAGGDPVHNRAIAEAMLRGEPSAVRDAVCVNAGLALVAAGIADGLDDGLARARESIDSGSASRALTALVETSQKLRP